jgi:1-acyl-sn-glycerol-3-phosphate acyltransferase
VYDLYRRSMKAFASVTFRVRATFRTPLPPAGPLILAPNHGSSLDHSLLMSAVARRLRIMAKAELFRSHASWFWSYCGAFPVRRGQRDEEAFVTANRILVQGGVVVMYPQGTRSHGIAPGEKPKSGIGRLALESGVPVVPVAICGTSRQSRRAETFRRTNVTLAFGQPMSFGPVAESAPSDHAAVALTIFDEIQALYATSVSEWHS